MGESELKIALQREGEEQVRAFWQAAEEKVAKRRQELKEEQEQLRLEAERQLQSKSHGDATACLLNPGCK